MIKLLHNDKNEKLPTVKNVGKEATDEIYMSPTVKVLKSEKDAWNYAGEEGIAEHSIMSGEVDYLEPNGKGKSFYNIGSIKPGQTMTINLGYFVDEDKMDSIFLDAFHYTGSGETEEELEIVKFFYFNLILKNHIFFRIRLLIIR
ncbi:ECF-type sigma factor negative effector [Niallia nealsonii AAU1]|nr:ECF-type sigma factor negative effector [Niallia nealsonii AAU1]